MKKLNFFLSAVLSLLLLNSSAFAACRCSNDCEQTRVVSPECGLSIVRGTVQLDSLSILPNGDLIPGISSAASIVRGEKFSISPEPIIAPNFIFRFPDITNSFLPTLPPSKQFTRIYEFQFDVIFDCRYCDAPTVLTQIESEGTVSSGTAFVSSFSTNVLNVTRRGFTVHAFLSLTGYTLATDVPPFISPDMNVIMNSLAGNTRINFEAIGPRRN